MSVSKGIDAEFLRALKQKNDIIEVVRSYVAPASGVLVATMSCNPKSKIATDGEL